MRTTVLLCAVVLVALVGTGCSWERRLPLTAGSLVGPLPARPGRSLVRFDPTIPGARLDETVWDNAVGLFWDVAESHQIGFDQHYHPQFYAIPVRALPAVAQTAVLLVDSRIVVPFGRIFAHVFESAARQSWSTHASCFADGCTPTTTTDDGPTTRLAVKLQSFVVWEAPLNHVNLYARVTVSSLAADGTVVKETSFKRWILEQRLGSIFDTHASMIRKMNDIANRLAEDLVLDILNSEL